MFVYDVLSHGGVKFGVHLDYQPFVMLHSLQIAITHLQNHPNNLLNYVVSDK